jgi:uncharacterized protein YcnI
MKVSVNNNLILSPYTKTKELKEKQVATGFSITANKIGVEPLELLVDTKIISGNIEMDLKKGTKIYFKEETLYTQQWPRKVFESPDFQEGFVVGNWSDVLYVTLE